MSTKVKKVVESRKIEASSVRASDSPSRFEVVLIEEGLGNFANAFYYDGSAIESAVAVYEGKKVMADHPGRAEEEDRPERSVRDILGHYEDLKAVEAEGRMQLQGVLVVPPGEQFDWARMLMQHAIEYAKKFPGKEFIGLSINASGDAEEVSIDEVLKTCPDACKPKLQEAKEMGIETVKLTKRITDAQSCDLVTEAGAGGKILKMLEAARRKKDMGKKKVKENANPAADQDHGDQDQDKALIQQMLDKHLGAGEHDEADHAMMKQALEAYQAQGMEGEAAEKAAAAHVKAAKHMASKKAESEEAESESESESESERESESEAHEDDAGADADGDDDGDEEPAPAPKKKKPPVAGDDATAEKKEMAKKEAQIVRLTAENGVLKEKLAKLELESHIEKKLKESGLPNSATKLLRESIKGAKNAGEFDKQMKIFVEARKHALGEAETGFEDVFENPERVTVGGGAEGGLSFEDAAQED